MYRKQKATTAKPSFPSLDFGCRGLQVVVDFVVVVDAVAVVVVDAVAVAVVDVVAVETVVVVVRVVVNAGAAVCRT